MNQCPSCAEPTTLFVTLSFLALQRQRFFDGAKIARRNAQGIATTRDSAHSRCTRSCAENCGLVQPVRASTREGKCAHTVVCKRNRDAEVQFAEIKVRAEIKCGELLKGMADRGERTLGGRPEKEFRPGTVITLESLGVSRKESHHFQIAAAAPPEKVKAAFQEARETHKPVTSAQIRALAKPARATGHPYRHLAIRGGTAEIISRDYRRPSMM